MKCYEVLRHLFMHIINCFYVTYDTNVKCWGVEASAPTAQLLE